MMCTTSKELYFSSVCGGQASEKQSQNAKAIDRDTVNKALFRLWPSGLPHCVVM